MKVDRSSSSRTSFHSSDSTNTELSISRTSNPDMVSHNPPLDQIAIQHLPLELLIEIFTLFDLQQSWGVLGRVYGRGLAILMLVCRLWYNAICTTPNFWRCIDAVQPPDLLSLFLCRSGGCTIDVRIFHPRQREMFTTHASVSLIVRHASERIRSLYVNLPPEDFHLVCPLFDIGMPALEHLDVVPIRRKFVPLGWTDLGLSQLQQPLLRSLIAKQVMFPQLPNVWTSLRVLKLYDFPSTTSGPMTTRDVIGLLKANVMLEELQLWCRAPSTSVSPESESDHSQLRRFPVILPNLRMLSIHGPYSLAAMLLLHLELPLSISNVDLRTSLPTEQDIGNTLSSFIPPHSRFLLERMSEASFQVWPSYNGEPWARPNQSVVYSPRPKRVRAVEVRDTMSTSLSFEYEFPGPDHHQPNPRTLMLRCLVQVLGWAPLRCLELSTLPLPTETDTYEGVFGAFPSLEVLEITSPLSYGGEAAVFAALQPVTHSDGHCEITRCPQLRTLRIHSRICASKQVAGEILSALSECTRARAKSGVRLETLDLHLWSNKQGDVDLEEDEDELEVTDIVEQMEKFVDTFIWQYGQTEKACERCS